jgi:hypothetical protein
MMKFDRQAKFEDFTDNDKAEMLELILIIALAINKTAFLSLHRDRASP